MIAEILVKAAEAALQILNDGSVWLVFSFALAGILHVVLKPEKFQRMLGNKKLSSILKANFSGMLLPLCSCGSIPLGLGMYYSGAYLGPTLAFMAASPIVNPAAILMSFGLLGPQISTIYIATGFVVPVLVGLVGNAVGGPELQVPGLTENSSCVELESEDDVTFGQKLLSGMQWGFMDLGVMVSKYIIIGVFLAGIIIAVVPQTYIQQYLGNPGMVSLAGIAALGAIMYVCAVGHIPFIAALVAAGAAPGVAVTFLMVGAATNIPELISIYKTIGRRAAAIYSATLVISAMAVGYLTNLLLMPGFVPSFDLEKTDKMVGIANKLNLTAPTSMRYLCSIVIFGLFLYAYMPRVKQYFVKVGA
ncbi:efflux transporter SaoE [Phosphitispora sp. TUW77]